MKNKKVFGASLTDFSKTFDCMRPTRFSFGTTSVQYFYVCHYFTNYAHDTTPYAIGGDTKEVLTRLTDITQNVFTWFANNQIKANHDKCHL